ncbi:MAG TPA: Nif3-like dinuclear metal center hexameric protein [Spirochaetota bacterium]|nr:Nif3-like dinuclear metal center hexameric protein [Spirochaetota bacterium]HOM38609.1 Nif3-like dinuclear metal center hexameric protein [Spirochaetota bacterium]HPQ49746.1 Nif3-like dinuclear metal center hexameric protein [Spirochaetota bacterium]
MKLKLIDEFLKNKLLIDKIPDISINGLQVGDYNSDIKKIAFSVDSNIKVIEKAVENKADLLIVHHGIFWGKVFPITGADFKKFELMIKNNLALYAIHLPLDLNREVGNNYTISKLLGLYNIEEFGNYHGINIGYLGYTDDNNIIAKTLSLSSSPRPFINNDRRIKSVAVVSGKGGSDILEEFIKKDIDLFVTGEIEHSSYNRILDTAVNVIALGHYDSEKFGILELKKILEKEFGLETLFIECPTSF